MNLISNNNTSQVGDVQQGLEKLSNSFQFLVALIDIISNLAIILPVLNYEKFRNRKELLMIIGVAICDVATALGFCIASIRRIVLIDFEIDKIPATPWYCQFFPHVFFFIVGDQTGSIMRIALSVDRLISIVCFDRYAKSSLSYVWCIFGLASAFSLISYSMTWILASSQTENVSVTIVCLRNWAGNSLYGKLYETFMAFCNVTAVVIYCAVVVALRIKTVSLPKGAQSTAMHRQIQVTRTIRIVVCCSLLFEVIPWFCVALLGSIQINPTIMGFLSPVFFTLPYIDSSINAYIYLWKLKDVRICLLSMFTRKLRIVGNSQSLNQAQVVVVKPRQNSQLTFHT